MVVKKWHVIRAIAWAVIWLNMNPYLKTWEVWRSEPDVIVQSIALYFVSGVILELVYRWLAWGRFSTRKRFRTAIRPECPEHPWICLLDKTPEEMVTVELFCADGVTRKGMAIKQQNGAIGFVVEFEQEELPRFQENPWQSRATHWRSVREDVNKREA